MKRFATTLALLVGIGGSTVGIASADTNVGVQAASIKQTAVANAPAVQYGGGKNSANFNSSRATAANYASISQWMFQLNR
jgi:hypothetical protein